VGFVSLKHFGQLQNRRQKVVITGALHSNLTKIPRIYCVSCFNLWGAWSFVWGDRPAKALPWRRDWSSVSQLY